MSRNRFHMGIRTKSTVSNTVLYVILVLMSIIWLTPLEPSGTESTACIFLEVLPDSIHRTCGAHPIWFWAYADHPQAVGL